MFSRHTQKMFDLGLFGRFRVTRSDVWVEILISATIGVMFFGMANPNQNSLANPNQNFARPLS